MKKFTENRKQKRAGSQTAQVKVIPQQQPINETKAKQEDSQAVMINRESIKATELANEAVYRMVDLVQRSAQQAQISNDRIEDLLKILTSNLSQSSKSSSPCKIEVVERDEEGFTKTLMVTPITQRKH